jgi:hypothetical protein
MDAWMATSCWLAKRVDSSGEASRRLNDPRLKAAGLAANKAAPPRLDSPTSLPARRTLDTSAPTNHIA